MLARYKKTEDGGHEKIADIYTAAEHGISPSMIDSDALKVAGRLDQFGYEAYIVGGAVRDLLLGRTPKDFDIATNALPKQVRKIFRNSRIIGKRFRLVHVHFGDKIIEVSTFRSNAPGVVNNVYGALEEDVRRRDFTLNALYYSTKSQYIIDFVGAFDDIKAGRMRALLPYDIVFKEDPVRLIRAVKYSQMAGFVIPRKLKAVIRRDVPELQRSSVSRLTEELFKILVSGFSAPVMKELLDIGLMEYLLPEVWNRFNGKNSKNLVKQFFHDLQDLDQYVLSESEISRGKVLSYFLNSFFTPPLPETDPPELSEYIYNSSKKLFLPLTPPNKEIEKAVRVILKNRGMKGTKRPMKKKGLQKNAEDPFMKNE